MKKNVIIILLLITIIISGCKNKTKLESVEKPFQNLLSKKEKKLKILDIESKSRPYAVVINNIGDARGYQSGLQDAYIIYEMISERGITRFLALFMEQNTKRIGSIRSARHYFLDYVLENDAIFVHHGQSELARRDFQNLNIDRIEVGDPKTAWRESELPIPSWHTLFTNIENIDKGLSNINTKRNKELLFNYSISEIDLSSKDDFITANDITVNYSYEVNNFYEYDAELKLYKRFVNNYQHKDYITGEQYTFKNIIIVKNQYDPIVNDSEGRNNLLNIGTFEGYYITNGYAVPIKVIKKNRASKTIYQYLNGEEITLNDGNTFIQIQPIGQELKIE